MVITKDRIHLLTIKSKPQMKVTDEDDDADIEAKRIEELEAEQKLIFGHEKLCFELMDFEFIQKLKNPKRTFILMIYNKDMVDAVTMP